MKFDYLKSNSSNMQHSSHSQNNKRIKTSHQNNTDSKKRSKNLLRVSSQTSIQDRLDSQLSLPQPPEANQEHRYDDIRYQGGSNNSEGQQSPLIPTISLQNQSNTRLQPLFTFRREQPSNQQSFGAPHVLEKLKNDRKIRNDIGVNFGRLTQANPTRKEKKSELKQKKFQKEHPQTVFSYNIPINSSQNQSIPIPKEYDFERKPRKIFNIQNQLVPNNQITTSYVNPSEQQQSNNQIAYGQNQYLNFLTQQNSSYLAYESHANNLSLIIPTNTNLLFNQIPALNQPVNYQNHNTYISQQSYHASSNLNERIPFAVYQNMQTFYNSDVQVPSNHIKWLMNLSRDFRIYDDSFINPFEQDSGHGQHLEMFPSNLDHYDLLRYFVGQEIASNATTNIYYILNKLGKQFRQLQNEDRQSLNNLHTLKLKQMKQIYPYFAAIKQWKLKVRQYLNMLKYQNEILKQRKAERMQMKLLKLKQAAIELKRKNIWIRQIEKSNELLVSQTKSTLQIYQAYQNRNGYFRSIYPSTEQIEIARFIAKRYNILLKIIRQHELLDQTQSKLTPISENELLKVLLNYFAHLCGQFADLKQSIKPSLRNKIARVNPRVSEEIKNDLKMLRLFDQIEQIIRKRNKYSQTQ